VTGIKDLRNRVETLEQEVIYGRIVFEEQMRQISKQTARNKLRTTINTERIKKTSE